MSGLILVLVGMLAISLVAGYVMVNEKLRLEAEVDRLKIELECARIEVRHRRYRHRRCRPSREVELMNSMIDLPTVADEEEER